MNKKNAHCYKTSVVLSETGGGLSINHKLYIPNSKFLFFICKTAIRSNCILQR